MFAVSRIYVEVVFLLFSLFFKQKVEYLLSLHQIRSTAGLRAKE